MGDTVALQATAFAFFPRLPTELRLIIWKYAAQQQDPPALCFNRSGYRNINSHIGNERVIADGRLWKLEFHEVELDNIPLKLAMLRVNHESRQAALYWTQSSIVKQGASLRWTAVRPVDPRRDTFYQSPEEFKNFYYMTTEVLSFGDECVSVPASLALDSPMEQIALNEEFFQLAILPPLITLFFESFRIVKVIFNAWPNLRRRWELGPPIRSYVWNCSSATFAWQRSAADSGYPKKGSRIEYFAERSHDEMVRLRIKSFEFQIVEAVPA